MKTLSDKGISTLNEDELLVQDNLFAVFDGCGSLVGGIGKDGKTAGKRAAEIAKRVFSQNKGTLKELALEANKELRAAMNKEGVDPHKKELVWGTTVAAVRVYKTRIEYFNVSDSLVLAVFEDGHYQLVTLHQNHDIGALLEWKKLADKKTKNIFKKLNPIFQRLRYEANKTYGLLNGDPAAENFFSGGFIPLKGVKSLLIFTDGLFIPKKDPDEPEKWDTFVELYLKKGLKGLLSFVRDIEEKDPECWAYPRIKRYDDATAIAIDFD